MGANTSEILEVRTKVYGDPVGRCIYCGESDGLTDEHVVPLGLSGNFVLPKASCKRCNSITSAFERKVLRGFMHEARTAGQFPTRRPKQRPRTLPLKVKRGDSLESIALPSDESPGFLHLPKLDRAAFLTGRAPVYGVTVVGVEILYFGKRPDDVATTLGADTIEATVNVDVAAFVRMLAKIGYAFAVAARGPYPLNEVPILPLILGSADDGGTWVGSADYRLVVEAKLPQHGLALLPATAVVDGSTEEILVAHVKLFASAGATGYEVVVRRRRLS
jgi:hypothetical protein